MRLEKKYNFDDALIVPNDTEIESRSLVNVEREFRFKWSTVVMEGVPIIAANMDTVGTLAMAKALAKHNVYTALHKHLSDEDLKKTFTFGNELTHNLFYSMGSSRQEFDRLLDLKIIPSRICIDIANGHSKVLLDAVMRVRDHFNDAVIMAGNVVTGDRAVKVIESGADIVKVGIGPGSACTTRKQTGVGYPQLSAVYECSKAVEEIGGMICADGGCVVPGDISKALIAGADFVMLGGMLAGTHESGGRIIFYRKVPKKSVKITEENIYVFKSRYYENLESLPDKAWKLVPLDEPKMLFYGMSSDTAMNKYNGGVANYRSSEGRTVLIPFKGHVEGVILDILGGIRSTMTYVDCLEISNMAYCAAMVETDQQLNTVFLKR